MRSLADVRLCLLPTLTERLKVGSITNKWNFSGVLFLLCDNSVSGNKEYGYLAD